MRTLGGKRKLGIFLLLFCLVVSCQTVWAQEGSATITVTVPEQPAEEIEATADATTLGEVPPARRMGMEGRDHRPKTGGKCDGDGGLS